MVILLGAFAVFSPSAVTNVSDIAAEFESHNLIVKVHKSAVLRKVLREYGLQFNSVRRMSGGAQVGVVETHDSLADLKKTLSRVRADSRIAYLALDEATSPGFDTSTVPPPIAADDPLLQSQWQFGHSSEQRSAINLYDAWQLTHGSAESVVAVIDSGVRFEHPDLAGRVLPGYDFVQTVARANDGDGRDADATDPGSGVDEAFSDAMQLSQVDCPVKHSSWHGTAIASLIAANSNDDYGMAGIDRYVNVLPVRVIGRCGGFRSDLLDAIRWSAGVIDPELPVNPTPARIINISLAIRGACTAADQSAIDDAVAAGALIVAGVGNDQQHLDRYPTSPSTCNNVLAVAALNADGTLAEYSNYGTRVDIAAPGGNDLDHQNFPIITASNKGDMDALPVSLHRNYSGTSVATPLVSGVLSLMLSIDPELSSTELSNLLMQSSRPFPQKDNGFVDCFANQCGAGMLDAALAVRNTLAYNDGSIDPEVAAAIATAAPEKIVNAVSEGGSVGPWLLVLLVLLNSQRLSKSLRVLP